MAYIPGSTAPVKRAKFIPLALRTDYEGEEDWATLSWTLRMGYPRCEVYTSNKRREPGVPMDYNTSLTASLDILSLTTFIDKAVKVVEEGKPGAQIGINCYTVKYENNVKTNDVILQSKLVFGKDDAGICYLAVLAEGKRKVKFSILPNAKFVKFVKEDGQLEIDVVKMSKEHAITYLSFLKTLLKTEGITDNLQTTFQDRKGNDVATSKLSEDGIENIF